MKKKMDSLFNLNVLEYIKTSKFVEERAKFVTKIDNNC